MNRKILAAAFALPLFASPALAQSLVFTSWGGTTQDAQKQDWAVPFTKQTGIPVLQDGPTDYGKLQAMIGANNVSWDVVDVEADYAAKAQADGLLTPLTLTPAQRAKIDPRFISADAVGSFYSAFVIGYNKTDMKGAVPATWADLFDLKKFPGKRSFYKWSSPGILEIALLADGVPPDKLYPLDLDRAFKKLDTIKKNIVWWGTGAQSQQLLASGQAAIGVFWNGRIYSLQQQGAPVGISWNQSMLQWDMLVIPKGAPHADAAQKFIAYATSAQGQAALAKSTAYAPVNLDSPALMDAASAANLPSHHLHDQITLNMQYWAQHRDEIANRWYAWQTQ